MKRGEISNSQLSTTFSCTSSLSSNDDEKLRFKKRKGSHPATIVSNSHGIKKTPSPRIKKSATLPSPASRIGELRKVKSEVSTNLGRGDSMSLETEPPSYDDQEAVVLDLEKSPGGNAIEMLKRDDNDEDDEAVKDMSMCQELTIIGSEDSQEEEVNVVEEKQLILSNPIPNQPKTKPRTPNTTESENRIQNLSDLIMWRDASKTGLVFGIGAFTIISSSQTWDFNMSFISVASYLGLAYLAAVFISRSFFTRESGEENSSGIIFGEEEAIWMMKLVLPYVNEFLLNFRALFSGDPFTTIKLAVLLFILAKYGGSITIWRMAKLVFVGIFTVPKACSAYSAHFSSYGILWMERVGNAWKSCSHKKAIGFVLLSIVWNVTSVVARIWTLFVLFVAFKCYQQLIVNKFDESPEDNIDEK